MKHLRYSYLILGPQESLNGELHITKDVHNKIWLKFF